MRLLFQLFRVVFIMVGFSISSRSEDLPPEMVANAKNATGFLRTKDASATAFCINPAGYFVTNHHAIRDVNKGGKVQIVLNPGEANEETLEATVVRSDEKRDLAILHASKANQPSYFDAAKFPFLELGDSRALQEMQRVVAFGFPFGESLALQEGKCPSISVNGGSVTALRKMDGALEEVQVDITLNHGNSGGPVLDKSQHVIGIVRAGIVGSGVNFIIPVQKLIEFLAEPALELTAPTLTQSNLAHKALFNVTAVWLLPDSKKTFDIKLQLTPEGKPAQTIDLVPAAGGYSASAAPAPAASGKLKLHLAADFPNGKLTGEVEDGKFQINGQDVWLHELETLRLTSNPPMAVVRRPVATISGSVTGISSILMAIGGQQIPIDLTKASQVSVSPPPTCHTVFAKVIALSQGKEIASITRLIPVGADAPAPVPHSSVASPPSPSAPVVPQSPVGTTSSSILAASTSWFVADDLAASLEDGAAVTGWPNDSSSGNSATATPQSAPAFSSAYSSHSIGGHAAVTFASANGQFLSLPATIDTAQFTMFAVVRVPVGSRGVVIGSQPSNYQLTQIANSTAEVGANTVRVSTYVSGANSQLNSNQPEPPLLLVDVTQTAASQFITVNGALSATGLTAGGFVLNTLGGLPGQSAYSDEDIAEVILFTTPLTNSQSSLVREYLRAKYQTY